MTGEDVKLDYKVCKDFALLEARRSGNQTFIRILKERYKDVINSPRTYEHIVDLESLINVLESRDVLNYSDIHVLEHIYEVLNLRKTILDNYNILIKRKSLARPVTHRGKDVENQPPPDNTSFQRTTTRHNFPGPFQNAKPLEDENFSRQRLSERVITEISTRIGGSWKELARYLKVQECIIHGISQDPSLYSNEAKTRLVLEEYERRIIDPMELKTKLINALDLAGRRDLRDDVQKLFLREF